MKIIFWENALKNIVIVLILIPSYIETQRFFAHSPINNDKAALGSFLIAVSILAVTACFGNFAFTYEKVKHASIKHRLLAHLTTMFLMLLIGLSLEMTAVVSHLLIGNFFVFNISLFILYIASVLYDFWDLYRT